MVSTIVENCHMKHSKSIISKENRKKRKIKITAQNFDSSVGDEKGRDKPNQVLRSKPIETTKDKTYYCWKEKAEACGEKWK